MGARQLSVLRAAVDDDLAAGNRFQGWVRGRFPIYGQPGPDRASGGHSRPGIGLTIAGRVHYRRIVEQYESAREHGTQGIRPHPDGDLGRQPLQRGP